MNKIFAKTFLSLATTSLAVSGLSYADVTTAPVDPTCGTASLATYDTAGFSCTIGDKTFSDFSFVPMAFNGATPITDSEVTVSPMGFGFQFVANPSFSAGSGETNTFSLSYNVSVTDPTQAIDSADLTFTPQVNPPLVGGFALIGAQLCNGSWETCTPAQFVGSVAVSTPGAGNTDNTTLDSPVTELGIMQQASAGGFGGTAGFDTWTLNVSQVPEPSFYGVLAAGMGAVLMLARRRKKTA